MIFSDYGVLFYVYLQNMSMSEILAINNNVFGAKRRKQPYFPSIKKENPICLLLKSKGLCP
ncbi:MAG: hypothetical protein CO120_01325 [Gammaproteobacteria bacterium CG_4_9_14_3_um_filter_38_9]|nr:MAG: hypothetical protein CO120_01325 [Gammaproteobacteria bacterium CG_4_9_14_3_um_filter_38_9]